MLIIAHRGASASEKENTYEAFLAAWEMRADAIETDIRRCQICGKLALSHEPVRAKEDCESTMLFEDLLKMKVKGAYLPLSNQEFFLGEQMRLHLEIKEKGLVDEILNMTQGLRYREQIVFSSFLWRELAKIRFLNSRVKIGLLRGGRAGKIARWATASMAAFLGANSIHVDFSSVNADLVNYFHSRGLKVFAYTVNGYDEIYAAWRLGLDGIFTDRPAYARKILAEVQNIVPQ